MKIAVVGSITRDHIVISKRAEEVSQPGGGVYYASLALANLGVDVLAVPLLSRKDDDLLGSLDHPNIHIVPQWTEETTVYQNTYPEESLDVCEKKLLSSVKGYSFYETILKQLADCDAIHLTPLCAAEFCGDVCRMLRTNFKGMISLDGQGYTQGPLLDMETILKDNVDVIKLDDFEARTITSERNEASAIAKLVDWNISEILITKASLGSTLHYNGDAHSIPAYEPTQIVDATGCGDTYAAAYLTKRIAGCDPIDAAHFASRLAAKSLEFKGALPVISNI